MSPHFLLGLLQLLLLFWLPGSVTLYPFSWSSSHIYIDSQYVVASKHVQQFLSNSNSNVSCCCFFLCLFHSRIDKGVEVSIQSAFFMFFFHKLPLFQSSLHTHAEMYIDVCSTIADNKSMLQAIVIWKLGIILLRV